MPGPSPTPWLPRFWAKVDQSAGPDGCWRWLGTHNPAAGRIRREWTGNTCRPRFRLMRTPSVHVYVAPLMLSIHDGVPLDERKAAGLYACHKPGVCPNAWCVNWAHLYWGTHEENVRDRYPEKAE